MPAEKKLNNPSSPPLKIRGGRVGLCSMPGSEMMCRVGIKIKGSSE